jgi:acyl-CoA synthetase (AMP-forming)/AMP-acid ligase II
MRVPTRSRKRKPALLQFERGHWSDLELDSSPIGVNRFFDEAVDCWENETLWNFIEEGIETTYGEARKQMNALAKNLQASGISRGSCAGIMLGNVPAFPLAWLALARLGAVSVPMNPKYTMREVEFIVADTEMTHLIVDKRVWEVLSLNHAAQVILDRVEILFIDTTGQIDSRHIAKSEQTLELGSLDSDQGGPNDVVSIQFTSGTTGLPKGCVLTAEYWELIGTVSAAIAGHPKRILADYPFYYMQNQFYLMLALASGGQLFVTHGLSLNRFLGWLIDYQIDFAWVSSAILRIPVSTNDRNHLLTWAPVDGVAPGAQLEMKNRFGINAREWYGSTEVGLGIVMPLYEAGKEGSIGVAMPYRETKIVDESLSEVRSGVVGELCIRGPGMMLGYHNKPTVNAELFLEGGWMRTGDLARKEDDGFHYFVGRIKDTIRRSGENISAQEIEQVLSTIEGVKEAAVIAVPDRDREEEVMAFIVADYSMGEDLLFTAVIDGCRAQLAPFKIPRYIEFCLELPRTSSGKVAKIELKELAVDQLKHDLGTIIEVQRTR